MKIVLRVQSALLSVIEEYKDIPRDIYIDWERVHPSSSARIAYLLAEKRNVDPVLAACATSVHDFGRIITGKQAGHAEAGYEPVQVFLSELGLFTEKEIAQIAIAVKNHSRKSEVGSPLEEIVKDADVIDMHQYGFPFSREEQAKRYEGLVADFPFF